MKFTKESFQKKYKTTPELPKKTEELDEDMIGGGGDTKITHNEIGTDTQVNTTVDKSDRKKGVSTTSEKQASQTKNTSADWSKGFNAGTPYGYNIKEGSKDRMRKLVKELLSTRNDSSEFVSNNNSSDVIRNRPNEIEPIDSLEGDVGLQNKVEELLNVLNGTDKSPEEIAIVLYHIINNTDTRSIDNNTKTIIKNAL